MTTLTNSLALTAQWSVIVFSAGSMLSVGLASPLKTLLAPMRSAQSVFIALFANFAVVPAYGFLVVMVFDLTRSVAIGILLAATAAGTPFLIKLTTTAHGDVPLSATLLMLLLPVTILFMPLVLPLVAPEASVSAWAVARPLLLVMLLPLGIGILARHLSDARTVALLPWLRWLTTVALILLIGASLARGWRGIQLVGIEGIGAAALLVLGAFGAGYALARRGPERRLVLGLGTGQRNIAAATVVATQTLDDPITTMTVVITALVGLAILFPIAWRFRRRSERREHT